MATFSYDKNDENYTYQSYTYLVSYNSQARVWYHCYYTRLRVKPKVSSVITMISTSACDITGLYPTTFDHK